MRTGSNPIRQILLDRAGLTIEGCRIPYGSGVLPEDFNKRLTRLKEASGLSWNGFAEALGVDPKQLLRWRHGAEPCGGAMLSLVRLAARIPGGLELVLGEDVQPLRKAS